MPSRLEAGPAQRIAFPASHQFGAGLTLQRQSYKLAMGAAIAEDGDAVALYLAGHGARALSQHGRFAA
ncbi:MAG: hypothetical protein QF767_13285, partial [Alphaproteobacteria bacterium]|nr:hypothetical protein [Alphaproteobacteria bacterium]